MVENRDYRKAAALIKKRIQLFQWVLPVCSDAALFEEMTRYHYEYNIFWHNSTCIAAPKI